MRFGRLGIGHAADPEESATTVAVSEPYVCPTLEKAVDRSTKHGRPAVLTLGGADGGTITFLAGFGGRVTVEEIDPPPVRLHDDDEAPVAPFKFELPSRGYDLILLWEWADFFTKEALPELGLELARISRPGATLLMLSRSSFAGKTDRPMRYKIHDEKTVSREPPPLAARRRFVHNTRTLELALKRFSISGIHLQRDQTREILAVRKA